MFSLQLKLIKCINRRIIGCSLNTVQGKKIAGVWNCPDISSQLLLFRLTPINFVYAYCIEPRSLWRGQPRSGPATVLPTHFSISLTIFIRAATTGIHSKNLPACFSKRNFQKFIKVTGQPTFQTMPPKEEDNCHYSWSLQVVQISIVFTLHKNQNIPSFMYYCCLCLWYWVGPWG